VPLRPLARWSLLQIVLVCAGWAVLCVMVPLIWVFLQARAEMARESASGGGGIGAVSMGVDATIVLVPPVVLVVAWLIARLRRRRARPTSP
jgi:ABC-type sulfate transport system permease subunit